MLQICVVNASARTLITRLFLVDVGEMVVKIFPPNARLFVSFVENFEPVATERFGDCLSFGTLCPSERNGDIVLKMLIYPGNVPLFKEFVTPSTT